MAEATTTAAEAADEASSAAASPIGEFLASHGGPYFELQLRLKLLQEQALNAPRRAVMFIAIAWLAPLILGLPGSLSLDLGVHAWLSDPGVWARFVIAIAAFVLAEQQVETGLAKQIGQFARAPLIPPSQFPEAARATAAALRRRNSSSAELVCLLFAYAAGLLSLWLLARGQTTSWAAIATEEGARITLAGWWTGLVSIPLFVFLFLRGIWRHFVWSLLLRHLARLRLRLAALHPDGLGGLGFIARYPNAYSFFIFGVSATLAAGLIKLMTHEALSGQVFTIIMGGWLILVILFFAYPLSAFSRPLVELKKEGLLLFGAQATRFQRASERKAIGRNVFEGDADEEEGAGDPAKHYDASRKLGTILLSRAAIVPVGLAALLPFAIAGSTILPYKEVFSTLKKLLLL